MDSETFASPESTAQPQVMSPNVAAVALEGETLGPSYGSVAADRPAAVLVNGVQGGSGAVGTSLEHLAGSRDDSLPGSSRHPPLDSGVRRTGPDDTAFLTGLGATTYSQRDEVGITGEPQGPVVNPQPQQSPVPHTAPPPITPARQSMQLQQHQQRPLLQDPAIPQPSTPSPNPSPTQYPDPANVPQPMQVVRSWTAQVASAAASIGQRMQFQAVLGQGQMELRAQDNREGETVHAMYDSGFQGYPLHFQGDPPPLPQHLQADLGYEGQGSGMFAGLARAGQALRRRVLEPVFQQVARSPTPTQTQPPQPHLEEHLPQVEDGRQHRSVLQPAVAEAMHEWTNRRSLIAPGPCVAQGQVPPRDEGSVGSLSSELVREEVRKQVQLAMAEKDGELRELRQQNERLKRALQSPTVPLYDENREQGQGLLGGGRIGSLDTESRPNPACRVPGASVPQGVLRPVYEGAKDSEGNPLGAGVPESVPVGYPGGPPEHGGQGGGRSGVDQQQTHGPARMPSMNSTVAEEPLQLLVQGMRQLQQAYSGKTDARDSELKGTVEVPEMPETGPEASVAFADWLYETEQAVGSLSDRASTWFSACLEVARQAYAEYTMASPLNRLAMQPVIPEALKDGKWARLERRVMTLLLGSMRKPAKEDAITHRIVDVPSLLFRLRILYQPGGASERAAVLKHLEGKSVGEDVHECVAALRKWRRYLERAEAMHVSVPDASILLRALETIVWRVLAAYPEVKFRVDLTKNELQLQGRPTLDAVLRFHTHILAELQMIAPVPSSATSATLKAIGNGQSGGTGETASPTSSPTKKGSSKLPCKFFSSKTGCVKGAACKFEHAFESKEDRKARCWECGSQGHRKNECPAAAARHGKGLKSQGKNDTSAAGSAVSSSTQLALADTSPTSRQRAILESIQAVQHVVDGIAPTSSSSSSSQGIT